MLKARFVDIRLTKINKTNITHLRLNLFMRYPFFCMMFILLKFVSKMCFEKRFELVLCIALNGWISPVVRGRYIVDYCARKKIVLAVTILPQIMCQNNPFS